MAGPNNYTGKIIGSYRVLEELGSGAYGGVYRGEHIFITGRVVAIKVLHGVHLDSQQELDNFVQEAQFLEKLNHPHILKIFDVSMYEGLPYLVVEYASGGSLKDRITRQAGKPLPVEEAIEILSQIGQGLQHAHQQGIIHRDLKPGNILFNCKDEVLLADFGISTMLETRSIKQVGAAGTPSYMAPEQFKGEVSRRSDQYSLGCIAYELLTGRRPFIAPDIIAMIYMHVMESPQRPTQLNSQLPVDIERAILKAIAKQRDDRYIEVSAFINAIGCTPKSREDGSTTEKKQRRAVSPAVPAVSRPRSQAPAAVHIISPDVPQKSKHQWLNEGNAHYRARHYAEALVAYECAISIDPNSSTSHNSRGETLEQMQRYEEALWAYEKAIACLSHYTDAWCNKGKMLYILKRYEEALAAYNRVLQIDDKCAVAYKGKGDTLGKLDRRQEALDFYERALQLKTGFAAA